MRGNIWQTTGVESAQTLRQVCGVSASAPLGRINISPRAERASRAPFSRAAAPGLARRPPMYVIHVKWPLYTNVRTNDEIFHLWDRPESLHELAAAERW